MLWLCLHFPRLPLSALDTDSSDVAIVDQRGSHRWLITDASEAPAGISLPQALAHCPELKTRARKPAAEEAALRSLGYWAYSFGQPVVAEIQDLTEPGRVPRALLWVEIGASLALFGGIEDLRDRLCSELMELGHTARIGIAPTRAGSALLACAGRSDPVTGLHELRTRLSDLPLSILQWPIETLDALRGIGLRRLSELFALPRDAFTRRFGADCQLQLDRLLGLASEPSQAIVPPETFRRRFELMGEVEETESLLFPLKRLCSELQAYLRARDRGVLGVSLLVRHACARETQLTARFVDPHRDARRVFDALHERLERDGLPLPARELVLVAEDFAEAQVPQNDLFDSRAAQAQTWSAAMERLRARLGEARVWTPQAVEDHRPQRAMKQFPERKAAASASTGNCRSRPAFLLRQPWPMPPPQLPPDAGFERIESGWWDDGDIKRDYVTIDVNGARAWAFRECRTRKWYAHGWWS